MRFNPRARLDTSQVEVRGRGGGGGGGGRLGPGLPGIPGGGGTHLSLGGIVVLVIVYLLYSWLSGVSGGATSGSGAGRSSSTSTVLENDASRCHTGADANAGLTCRLVGITNSVQSYWSKALPQQTGKQYPLIKTVLFSGSVATNGCGQASSQVGPFYCPNDQRVYLDASFFHDMLVGQLGGRDSGFTEAYVIAHEYGHHIENQLGLMGRVRTQQGPSSDSVKLELMADCLAGAWAQHATHVPGPDGQILIQDLTQKDVSDAIQAAQTVGDDRIQRRMQGRVTPESWTHGSAQQRETAFSTGYQRGTIKACDYFDGAPLPRP